MSFVYTLTAEGGSDDMLIPLIDWVLAQLTTQAFSGRLAKPAVFANKAKDVETRVAQSLRYFPCQMLFVHRDSDGRPHEDRVGEVLNACDKHGGCFVPLVPIRMTEAWFLFNQAAVREAADNPRGRSALDLPTLREAERRSDPKRVLEEALVRASEASGRRLKNFKSELPGRKRIVAERIDDFSPLMQVPSFRSFYDATSNAVRQSALS